MTSQRKVRRVQSSTVKLLIIETNIEAGCTLYTDHKPALFENSLSNIGQLNAWKLAEVSDLLSVGCRESLSKRGGSVDRRSTVEGM
jgi:hypothetical protein